MRSFRLSLPCARVAVLVGGGFLTIVSPSAQDPSKARPATVIVDAAAFLEHMPKGTIITQAGARGRGMSQPAGSTPQAARQPGPLPPDAWLFNNTALVMRGQAYLQAKVDSRQPRLRL